MAQFLVVVAPSFIINTYTTEMPEVLTGGGIPIASPATVAHHTMRYENAAIHRMLPTNVMMKNFFSGKNIREKRFI